MTFSAFNQSNRRCSADGTSNDRDRVGIIVKPQSPRRCPPPRAKVSPHPPIPSEWIVHISFSYFEKVEGPGAQGYCLCLHRLVFDCYILREKFQSIPLEYCLSHQRDLSGPSMHRTKRACEPSELQYSRVQTHERHNLQTWSEYCVKQPIF